MQKKDTMSIKRYNKNQRSNSFWSKQSRDSKIIIKKEKNRNRNWKKEKGIIINL